MTTPPPIPDHQKLEELRQYTIQVQQNIHPMDQVRAEARIDAALWKGFEKPTGVQKAGLIIFGSFFMLFGVAMILGNYENRHHSGWGFIFIFGLVPIALGVKIGSNAFRQRKKKKLA